MNILKKTLKIAFIVILCVIALVTTWWLIPERTPQIKSTDYPTISTIDYMNIGGIDQCILQRSKNTNNPIMLFLHGGPGMPMMYLAHEFQRSLEENFTVIQWDRRGSGKTYNRNKPTVESMNVRQIINDAYALIDTLKNRYNQDKIILVGHSFGTYLGSIMVKERPELFKAYISIGQVVDDEKSRLLQENFIREQAIKYQRKDIISELNTARKPDMENWLFEFGGELKKSKSFFPLIWSGMQAPEYTLREVSNVAKGSFFSSSNMKYNVLSKSVFFEITRYDIPVYFFVGTSDYTTPHQLIKEYYQLINAPKKELIYFENSAHFPFFEEPEKFCTEINRLLMNKN